MVALSIGRARVDWLTTRLTQRVEHFFWGSVPKGGRMYSSPTCTLPSSLVGPTVPGWLALTDRLIIHIPLCFVSQNINIGCGPPAAARRAEHEPSRLILHYSPIILTIQAIQVFTSSTDQTMISRIRIHQSAPD
jgi:hypothetical protein